MLSIHINSHFSKLIRILVVSDGVGGWSQYGIDPGKYSKKLCQL
jgi:hypothetical protein